QCAGITPELVRHADLVLAPTRQHLRTELAPQEVERTAQRRPGVLLVEFRPEEGEQRVAAGESTRGGGRRIGQEAEAAGLSKHRGDFGTVWAAEVQDAEGVKPDHRFPEETAAAGSHWGYAGETAGRQYAPT